MSLDFSSSYRESILDKLSDVISPVLRKMTDLNNDLFGTSTQLLRITRVVNTRRTNSLKPVSVLGDYYDTYETDILHNVRINYPFNDIEVFLKKESDPSDPSKAAVSVGSVDVTDIVPITATLHFEGDYDVDPINVYEGDKLVDVFWDHKNNPIPIFLELKRLRSSFFGKNEISKRCEMAIFRGPLDTEIQLKIDEYLQFIQDARAEKINRLNQ